MKNLFLSFFMGMLFIPNLSAQNDTLYFNGYKPDGTQISIPSSQIFPGPRLSGLSQYKLEFEDSVKFMLTSVELYDTNQNFLMKLPVWLDTLPSVFNPPVTSAFANISTMLNSRMKVMPKLMDSLDIHLFLKLSFYHSTDSANFDTLSSYFWINKNNPYGPLSSLSEATKQAFYAYPSPFTNKISIGGFETVERNIHFVLYRIDGKLVEEGWLSSDSEVILRKEHKGIFILQLKTKEEYLGSISVMGKG